MESSYEIKYFNSEDEKYDPNDIKPGIPTTNYTVPFDFNGKQFLWVEFLSGTQRNICLSNIGNILLKLKKYDIAILHLIESDTYSEIDDENKKEYGENDYNSISMSRKKKKKKSKKNSILKRNLIDNDLNKEQIDQKIIEENKPLIVSRYPKLIHCYKQFFKSLKKLKKS